MAAAEADKKKYKVQSTLNEHKHRIDDEPTSADKTAKQPVVIFADFPRNYRR